jgi:release factor glutamine methyltransferase
VKNQMVLFDTYLNKIEESWFGLPDKLEENPDNTLRALWLTASGHPKAVTLVDDSDLPGLDGSQIKALEHLVDERINGTPLAYLTGRQEWMGMEFLAKRRKF